MKESETGVERPQDHHAVDARHKSRTRKHLWQGKRGGLKTSPYLYDIKQEYNHLPSF